MGRTLRVTGAAGHGSVNNTRLGSGAILQKQRDGAACYWSHLCRRGQLHRSFESLSYRHQSRAVSPRRTNHAPMLSLLNIQLSNVLCRRALAVQLYLKIDRIQQADEQVKVRAQLFLMQCLSMPPYMHSLKKCTLALTRHVQSQPPVLAVAVSS